MPRTESADSFYLVLLTEVGPLGFILFFLFFGKIVMIALRLGTRVDLDFGVVQRKHLAITGSMLRPRPVAEKGRLVAAVGKAVWPLIERGQIKPVVDWAMPM